VSAYADNSYNRGGKMIRQKRRTKYRSPVKKLLRRLHDWRFPIMTPEQFNKRLYGGQFLGIVERFPKDSGELERLKEMLEDFEKQINTKKDRQINDGQNGL